MKYSFNYISILLYLFIFSLVCKGAKNELLIILENTSKIVLEDYPVYLELDKLNKKLPVLSSGSIDIYLKDKALPVQEVEKNGKDYILTIITIQAGEKVKLVIKRAGKDDVLNDKKRTHAELSIKTGGQFVNRKYEGGGNFVPVDSLRVPNECTDHSNYIKYEGPGWESDKVAYRLYLDWRNAVDIFGKITTDIALPNVGMDGFDSYHKMADWGLDILNVGKSLGMASIGTWTGGKAERVAKTDSIICTIEADGDIYSAVRTRYYNWQNENGNINLDSWLSIEAGSRMTKQVLLVDGNIKNIATGIVKTKDIPLMKSPSDSEWGYIATWGLQSLNNDKLGMVVFYKNEDLIEITEDELSYVAVLKPNKDNKVKYYYAGVWEKENGKVISEEDFKSYIESSLVFLSKPVNVTW